jgi:hypothetical protein
MSNAMIIRYLQDKGLMPANEFELEQWRFDQEKTKRKSKKSNTADQGKATTTAAPSLEGHSGSGIAAAVPRTAEM